jgi:spermidine dehydrogenase
MSWETFIREKMSLGDHAVRFANLYATDLGGLGCDAVSARFGFGNGPGFAGMGGYGFYEENGILKYGYGTLHRYPDGSHTIARHLLKRILPEAVPGPDTMEGVFSSRIQYDQFDRPEHRVRVRLRSAAVRVEHVGDPSSKQVAVHYVSPEGRVSRVTARSVVVAAWAAAVKHIVPELSAEQKKALEDYRYCSEIYINVALRNWKPIAKIGAFEMFMPDGYCTWMHVNDPLHVGEYKPEFHPDKPTLLNMYKYIHEMGLDPEEQMVLGRTELETKTFEDHEREIRTALNHVLGPWGFNAAEDIVAITVNRWGHGYVYANSYQGISKFENPARDYPQVEGRASLGRISFAGADAAGNPWTQATFVQAHRAAMEQLELS